MSSNKTIIPGMEDAYTELPQNHSQREPQMHDGTFVPNPFGTVPISIPNQKPVVGFLYSIQEQVAVNIGRFTSVQIV